MPLSKTHIERQIYFARDMMDFLNGADQVGLYPTFDGNQPNKYEWYI